MRLDEIRERGPQGISSNDWFDIFELIEAAVKLRDLRNAEPRMVHWDVYAKWMADVADAVTAVENAVDAFEEATG